MYVTVFYLGILLCSLMGNHRYEDVDKMAIILRKIQPNLAIN
jgi:hypothetical protein